MEQPDGNNHFPMEIPFEVLKETDKIEKVIPGDKDGDGN